MESEVIQNTMNAFEIISFIASIASLILALGAIWLSIVFFKMSSEASKATTEAAKGIEASVKRLENLFDKLYSDTFSMMKDTVSDMRKHIWNKPLPEGKSAQKSEISDALKVEIETQVSKLLKEAGVNDAAKNQELSRKLESSLEELFEKSKKRKQSIKTARVQSILSDLQPISFSELTSILNIEDQELAIRHLFPLREQGKVSWDGPENQLSSDSIIKLIEESEE